MTISVVFQQTILQVYEFTHRSLPQRYCEAHTSIPAILTPLPPGTDVSKTHHQQSAYTRRVNPLHDWLSDPSHTMTPKPSPPPAQHDPVNEYTRQKVQSVLA